MFFVESSVTSHMCPKCRGILTYRDSRPRIRKHEGGGQDFIIIRRFRCENCHSYHNELPDCLLPYKHYETEVISGVLDGVITEQDEESEDFPSLPTIHRWLLWLKINCFNIEGFLRNAACSVFQLGEDVLFSMDSLLDAIRNKYQNWLEIVIRLVYNSGGSLVPISG